MPPLERVRRRTGDPPSPRRRQRLDESCSYVEDSNEARDSFETADDGFVHAETVTEDSSYYSSDVPD